MPESSISSDHAYQIVKDELELDGKPSQNCASFVTTYVEPNCRKLMVENLSKNLADVDEYPQSAELQNRCVAMLANLFNAPKEMKPVGTACIGSSEGIMLAGLAMKFNWRNKKKAEGKPSDKPNIIFGHQAQVALEKFARYFDVEQRLVPVSEASRYCMDPNDMIKQCDENTIGIMAILGSTYAGQFEEIEQMNNLLVQLEKEKGWSIPIHVDAASGGFIAPFSFPDLKWDFRLEKVVSVNTSGHKFGYVLPGIGWVVWKDASLLPKDLIFELHYLGGTEETYNLNFSRSAAHVVAQYYNFIRLGKEGYKAIANNCLRNALLLSECLLKSGYFILVSDLTRPSLPVVSFAPNDRRIDPFKVSSRLRTHGWIVPAYSLPPNCEDTTILRVVIRENFSEDVVDSLLRDIINCTEEVLIVEIERLKIMDEAVQKALKEQKEELFKKFPQLKESDLAPAPVPQKEQNKSEEIVNQEDSQRMRLAPKAALDDKEREQKTYARVC